MIAITHFADDAPDFSDRARAALAALAARPGYVRGTLGRSTDDAGAWIVLTEWDDVGSYRRALGNYDVKINATPLLASALDVPSAFESLLDVAPDGRTIARESDRSS
jgi:hypothetical protein